MWNTIDVLIQAIKARTDQMLKRLEQKNITTFRTTLDAKLKKRIPGNHPDHELLCPLLIPLAVIGSKYDLMTFYSNKDEIMVKKLKNVFSHLAFGSSDVHYLQTELGKPLFIPVGSDSFSDIGAPPNLDLEVGRLTAKTPLDMWKAVFCSKFPQTPMAKTSLGHVTPQLVNLPQLIDPGKDAQYAEPLIDNARKAKDEEWERLRRQGERKMRDLLQQVTADGLIIA